MAFCAMLQRTLDFDSPNAVELKLSGAVAEHLLLTAPPFQLVRPNRQLSYGGLDPSEWPAHDDDGDTITVDRLREDIDGPPHRFVIKRCDVVEVFLDSSRTVVGRVTEISHRSQEVRIEFQDGAAGVWVAKESVYPARENASFPAQCTTTPPEAVNAPSALPPAGESLNGKVPACLAPYTFDAYKAFRLALANGSLSYSEYQLQFARLLDSRESLVSELKSRFKAKELAVIASRMGCWDAKRASKEENADSIYQKMLASFVLDGIVSYSMGERYEDAVRAKVRSTTLEAYAAEFEKRQAADLAHEKALANPQTFFEFRTFLQEKTEDDLTDEQLARYDALHADMTRARRTAEAKTTVEQFKSEELDDYQFQIKEGYHDKRQCPVWIVQLPSRVERATFDELNRKAKMLGGWYSSFKKSDAGFQFLDEERAKRFVTLLSGEADRSDVLTARKARRETSAAERLHELASELALRADETIDRSNVSLQNTERRADIQAGVRGRAFADQALARTIHSIAEALSRGQANYLDGIRHKTHVETLEALLYIAKWARVRALKRKEGESNYSHGRRLDRTDDQPIGPMDVRFAAYPFPQAYKRHLEELILRCRTTRGVRQAAEKMHKRLVRESDDYVTFREAYDVEALSDFLGRAKAAGVDVERVALAFEKHRRLQRAGITDVHELRAALREYLNYRAEARGDDPVKVAERELIGKKLPGFFPTPPAIISRMLELAEIAPEHFVLEPSCGKGDIVDAVRAHHPAARVCAIERNLALAEVLAAKGLDVEFGDFLEHPGAYDRIVMNPPFEEGADMEHVRHAFSLLKPGGRLVSVVCEGPFFRVDNKSVAFRDWLEEVGADVERLPDDAFSAAEAFRVTGVRTRLVTITKSG